MHDDGHFDAAIAATYDDPLDPMNQPAAIEPAVEAGLMAPASVKGVMTSTCPCSAMAISPSAIGMSSCRGELVLMMPSSVGLSFSPSGVVPMARAAISIPSIVRAWPSVWVCQFLSRSVIWA